MDTQAIDVSRVLFGFAAAYHYLFVPLTVGLMALIALMEGLALFRRDPRWRIAADFWSRLFLVNFVCGAVTGWPLRYLIEQQWSRYADRVGEVFGWVFAFEGRVAPWLFGLVVLVALRRWLPGWARATVSAALALLLIVQSSAILVLNAWMQYPVGVEVVDGRFHLVDVNALLASPLAHAKIVHTVAAAYVLGGMFVLAVGAACRLRGWHDQMARLSMRVAAPFTLLALVATGVAGHWSGERVAQYQPAKFAAIEALWYGEPTPEALTLFAMPDGRDKANHHAVRVPFVLGWLAGRPEGEAIPSRFDIVRDTRAALAAAVARPAPSGRMSIEQYQRDHGVLGLLPPDQLHNPTPAQLDAAAERAVPPVRPLFWGFRVMVLSWLAMGAVVACVVWRQPDANTRLGRCLLWGCALSLPLPWLATEAGWLVCELGRQPWLVTGALSTAQGVGDIPAGRSALSLLGWGGLYAALLVANVLLTLRLVRGPAQSSATLPEVVGGSHAAASAG